MLLAQISIVYQSYLQSQIPFETKAVLLFPIKYFWLAYIATLLFTITFNVGPKIMPFVIVMIIGIGLNLLLGILMTYFVFKQTLNLYHIIGIVLILLGLFAVNRPTLSNLIKK